MSAGFYQRLGVPPDASAVDISAAYHQGLTRLVGRLRAARASGADTTAIEAERDALTEAHAVLTDPQRRRRYDHMRSLEGQATGGGPAELRAALLPALSDPAAAAAIELLTAITSLQLGGPAKAPPRAPPPPPPPRPVSMLSAREREQRARAVVEPPPEPAALPPPLQLAPALMSAPEAPAPPLPAAPNTAERDLLSGTLGFDGRYIAALRQARGVDLDELASTTRISRRYLEAIEANAFERLPAAVFVRGYLREIAGVLEIDDESLIHGFMDLYAQHRGG